MNQGWEPDSPCSTSGPSFSWIKLRVWEVRIHHTGNITIHKLRLKPNLTCSTSGFSAKRSKVAQWQRTNSFSQTFAFLKYLMFLKKIWEIYNIWNIQCFWRKSEKCTIYEIFNVFEENLRNVQLTPIMGRLEKFFKAFIFPIKHMITNTHKSNYLPF